MQQIKVILQRWDDKTTSDLQSVYDLYSVKNDFSHNYLALIAEDGCDVGATWLIKHHLKQDVISLFDLALTDKAASVKTRITNALKHLN